MTWRDRSSPSASGSSSSPSGRGCSGSAPRATRSTWRPPRPRARPGGPAVDVAPVAEVLQPGWRLASGRVLRPAGVVVSEPGAPAARGADDAGDQQHEQKSSERRDAVSARDYVEKDYYATLGVPKDAKAADIKKAYRKLAAEHHPDRNPAGEERFKEVSEAYDVLSDEGKRREYDEARTLFGSGGGGFGGGGFEASDLFGGGGVASRTCSPTSSEGEPPPPAPARCGRGDVDDAGVRRRLPRHDGAAAAYLDRRLSACRGSGAATGDLAEDVPHVPGARASSPATRAGSRWPSPAPPAAAPARSWRTPVPLPRVRRRRRRSAPCRCASRRASPTGSGSASRARDLPVSAAPRPATCSCA